uniref:Ubiquitin-like protease family profile domain-containing protein n=1 Tax=Cajanus cajan TaxID=3821 RepID=A0A151SYH6_CAJCA|nr:hypothetical protein KK1_015310 [Cajanus cajan]
MWVMARTKSSGEMTSKSANQIVEKINELDEQASQGSFVPDGRQDILNTALGRPEHPGRVRAARVGTTIGQYFGRRQSQGLAIARLTPKDLELLTQQVVAQLKKNDINNTQTQDVPPVQVDLVPGSSKGSCPTPSSATAAAGNALGDEPHVDISRLCELCIDDIPPRVVAIGRVYEGSSTIHHVPLSVDLVKVVVEFVRDFDAHVPVPTSEVQLTHDIPTVHRSKPSNDPICDLREASLTLTYGNPFKSYKQQGHYECGYYVMNWMSEIIEGGITNGWSEVHLKILLISFNAYYDVTNI